jgi:hypothetical protein
MMGIIKVKGNEGTSIIFILLRESVFGVNRQEVYYRHHSGVRYLKRIVRYRVSHVTGKGLLEPQ